MKNCDIKITVGEKVFFFRGVYDIRIVKTLSFSKTLKLKGGTKYKLRYTFDLEAFKEKPIIEIEESNGKKWLKRN